MKNFFGLVLVVVLVAGGMFSIYYFGFSKQKSQNRVPVVSATPTVTSAFVEVSPTTKKEGFEEIAAEVKKAIVAKHGQTAQSLNVTVASVEGYYAKGGASVVDAGGGMWFAAKTADGWQLVWDGNGIITCDSLTDYPYFPVILIPQCYDEDSQKMIERQARS